MYYYKTLDNKGLLRLFTPDYKNNPNYVEITEEDFIRLSNTIFEEENSQNN